MKLKDIATLANSYPTIMALDQEIFLMRALQGADIDDILDNKEEFMSVVSQIWDSHTDNGVFHVNKDNEGIFQEFARWLRAIEEKYGISLSHAADDIGLSAEAIAKAMPGRQ